MERTRRSKRRRWGRTTAIGAALECWCLLSGCFVDFSSRGHGGPQDGGGDAVSLDGGDGAVTPDGGLDGSIDVATLTPPTALGDVADVTTPGASHHGQPDLAVTAEGVWALAWTDFHPGPGDDYSGIRAALFTYASTVPVWIATDVAINQTTAGSQFQPKGAGLPLPGVNLAFVFYSTLMGNRGAQGRIVEPATGQPLGTELDISASGERCATQPVVSAPWVGFPPASFAEVPTWTLVWQESSGEDANGQCANDWEVKAARLDSDGLVVMPATTVLPSFAWPNDRLPAPAVGVDGEGRSLVVWVDRSVSPAELRGRIIAPDGTLADPLLLAPGIPGDNPAVAGGNRGFLVVYCEDPLLDYLNTIPFTDGIRGIQVDAAGDATELGNLSADAGQTLATMPAVAFGPDRYVVVWTDLQQTPGDGASRLAMRRFDEDGAPLDAGDLQVHSPSPGLAECLPTVDVAADGTIGVAWQGCSVGCPHDYWEDAACAIQARFFHQSE